LQTSSRGFRSVTMAAVVDAPPTEDLSALEDQLAALQLKIKMKKEEQGVPIAPYSASFQRTMIDKILGAEDGGVSLLGKTITVGGWVKTGREAEKGAIAFLAVNDGSMFTSLQVVVPREVAESSDLVQSLKGVVITGSSVLVEGTLVAAPEGKEQKVELKATKLRYVGQVDDAASYPLAKKKTSMEFLREKAHLRPRTNTVGAVARIRNELAYATHTFFQQHGFLYVHTPIITASDTEGAGEMFQVTTLLGSVEENGKIPQLSADDVDKLKQETSQQGSAVKEAKAAAAAQKDDPVLMAAAKEAIDKLMALKAKIAQAESGPKYDGGLPRTADGKIDYRQDFFDRPAFLTVSGQLQVENFACSLSNVYTFSPTFRAENSRTSRHLAEFWMVEPEMAFCTLEDDMACAEAYVRFCCRWLLEHCKEDMDFINKMVDKSALERLRHVAETPFKRITYTEAVEILEGVVRDGKKKFEFPVSWGIDLASEHERYLTEDVFQQPVIVYNYPKDIKAFYMRLNDDNKTVGAMDVLVPKVGELIGGSQREERLDVLERRIKEAGMEIEPYVHYLELRKYGTVPHSGFGLGFERLILFATGIDNIRDVIPFPRWPGNADF